MQGVTDPMEIRGGNGNDALEGGGGEDLVVGGPGDDGVIDGGLGIDTFSYDDGRSSGVTVILDNGNAECDGGVADNACEASREALVSFENVVGSDAADDLTGDVGPSTIDGQDGADTMQGDNEHEGGGSRDELKGGLGADTIKGGPGNDELYGGAGNDTLDGEAHADLIRGEADFDTVDYSSRTLHVHVSPDHKQQRRRHVRPQARVSVRLSRRQRREHRGRARRLG